MVVTDFGLARLARSSRSAPMSGVLAGTPEYWAPEQAAGRETGPATDLYALGCVLFRMLAGRMPFEGEDRLATGLRRAHEAAPSLAAAAPAAPPAATALVDRLLDREPSRRGDAVEAAAALGADPSTMPGPTGGSDDDRRADVPPAMPWPTLVTRILRDPATIVGEIRSHRAIRRGRLAGAVAAILVALVAAGGGVYAVASDDPAGVSAPDVVGKRLAAARGEVKTGARDAGLPAPKVKVVDRSYSESVPAGAIIAQDPPDGKRIPEGGALLVSVSKGSAFADVPSVAGLEGSAAFELLERKGFTPTRRYAPSVQIEAWHATGTVPASGTRLERPARLALVVSTGPPKRLVPSVDALAVDDATRALRAAGFSPVVSEQARRERRARHDPRRAPRPGDAYPDRYDGHDRRRTRAALGADHPPRGDGGRFAGGNRRSGRRSSGARDHGHVTAGPLGRQRPRPGRWRKRRRGPRPRRDLDEGRCRTVHRAGRPGAERPGLRGRDRRPRLRALDPRGRGAALSHEAVG